MMVHEPVANQTSVVGVAAWRSFLPSSFRMGTWVSPERM
jgi:hypothetical protein